MPWALYFPGGNGDGSHSGVNRGGLLDGRKGFSNGQ